ncbi:peptide transporter [Musa troglodytarum]|uniref:Peptide transporter n=1 Tax=Musa troglodytarum TaxID=320322 RepID=A0A9E7L9W3_9LILI|nr:peptide transporter [Musa troglodytarum]
MRFEFEFIIIIHDSAYLTIRVTIPTAPKDRQTTMEATDERYTKDGTTDIHGRPAVRKNTGNWRACPYILGIILKSPN